MNASTLLFGILFATTLCAGEPQQLKPVDEAAKDPSFFIFRARLIQAVSAKDTEFLISVLAPDVLNSFGGNGGIAEFREMWNPEDPKSEVWSEFAEILSMGGKVDNEGGERGFSAPYFSACFPNELDAIENAAIIGENVRLRKEPSANAEVVGSLSWDIVQVGTDSHIGDPEVEWIKVTTLDGKKTGYVSNKYVRSSIGLRAGFSYRSGRWLITSLVGGD